MITKKLLTEDIKFSRSKGKLHVKYKGKQLAVVAESTLFKLLLDASPMSFVHDLAKVAGVEAKPQREYSNAVLKMAKVYAYERLKFAGKKPASIEDEKVQTMVSTLLGDKKIIADFNNAIKTMVQAEIKDITFFIQAQIDGLKFVNDGKGTFPKPSQLCTMQALDRSLSYITANNTEEAGNKTDKPKQYWFFNKETDGNLTLKQNNKFNEVMEKIKKGNATLEECIYANKCYAHRRSGATYSKIDEYIKKISK